MRITGLRATPVAIPFRHDEIFAFGGRRGMIAVLVELDTDEGVVGIGEAAAYPSAETIVAVLRSIEPLIAGEDPFAVEQILKRIYLMGSWHHVRATSPAIAAVETACWDVIGKVCGQPLVNLFGGRVRDEVEYFCYLTPRSPEELKADARRGAEEGFRTFYLKTASPDPREDIERVAAIRDGAGPEARIRVDANESWSSAAAVGIVREMQRYELELVEQPISARNLPELAYLRSRLDVPLLANEASWTRYDQLEVIRHAAADVISVDHQMDGGLLNLKRGAGMCEVAGLPVLKHMLGELGVAQYAALHVIASTPNFLYANQGYGGFLEADVIGDGGPLPYRNGKLAVPDAPGIGVTVNSEIVAEAAERYERDGPWQFATEDPSAVRRGLAMPKI